MITAMKILRILPLLLIALVGCKEKTNPTEASEQATVTETSAEEAKETIYGAAPTEKTGVAASEALEAYQSLQSGDTLATAFRAEVLEVCQAKGCWMRLALSEDQQVMVRFKDYGFFVPTDLAGSEVMVEGIAFISEVSEEERKHLAEDGGAKPEELSSIVGPTKEYGFEASGVRLQKAP